MSRINGTFLNNYFFLYELVYKMFYSVSGDHVTSLCV